MCYRHLNNSSLILQMKNILMNVDIHPIIVDLKELLLHKTIDRDARNAITRKQHSSIILTHFSNSYWTPTLKLLVHFKTTETLMEYFMLERWNGNRSHMFLQIFFLVENSINFSNVFSIYSSTFLHLKKWSHKLKVNSETLDDSKTYLGS